MRQVSSVLHFGPRSGFYTHLPVVKWTCLEKYDEVWRFQLI